MSDAELKVLKMVEEGKISAADAIGLLEALKKAERKDEEKSSKSEDFREKVREDKEKLKEKIKEELQKHKVDAKKIKIEVKEQMKKEKEHLKEELKNLEKETDDIIDSKELEQEIKDNVMENLFAVVSGIPKMVKKSIRFGHKVEPQEIEFEEKESVQIKLVSGDLEIIPSEDDKIHMVCETIVPIDKELEKENQSLKMSFTYGDVRLSIPETLKNVNINVVSGDITGNFSAENISVNSISGDINLRIDKYSEMAIKTKSGDILLEVKDISASEISAKTLSGDISVPDLKNVPGVKSDRKSFQYSPEKESQHRLAVSSLAGDIQVLKIKED
ncbi:MAG: DUF4097 family beta strand repeat-containing protein [bacterium]|nr:DUF4097 family beta strand repeat-containing protein [bacterium]